MTKLRTNLVLLISLAALGLSAAGCATSSGIQAADDKGKAELWQQNCGRCHFIRSPDTFNDAEWQVAIHHMRLRAMLTAEEQKQILELMKASH